MVDLNFIIIIIKKEKKKKKEMEGTSSLN